jgi:hypothetical protein
MSALLVRLVFQSYQAKAVNCWRMNFLALFHFCSHMYMDILHISPLSADWDGMNQLQMALITSASEEPRG